MSSTAMANHHRPLQAVALHLLLQTLLAATMAACSLLPSSPAAGAFTSNNTAAVAQVLCLQNQETALLRLKRSFTATSDDDSIAAFRSWKAGTDCCSWAGVRCGDADGRVTSLDLGNWGLESAAGLDPALFDLSSLR
jgi:hypothetical protein